MTENNKSTGASGERDTLAFLEARGYGVVDINVRPLGGMARGEIDVIAWDGEYLVFVEVKTRRAASGQQGTPTEAIDARKQKQLTRLAMAYLAKHNLDDVPCRFDVVAVIRPRSGLARFTLLRDAFAPVSDTD